MGVGAANSRFVRFLLVQMRRSERLRCLDPAARDQRGECRESAQSGSRFPADLKSFLLENRKACTQVFWSSGRSLCTLPISESFDSGDFFDRYEALQTRGRPSLSEVVKFLNAQVFPR